MTFSSANFLFFFVAFFILYWFVFYKNLKAQNTFILCGSLLFYVCWDWRFLILLLFTATISFLAGIKLSKTKNESTKQLWLIFGLVESLGVLIYFKYFNFFIASFIELFQNLGVKLNPFSLQIILPIGISFYTFKVIGYLLDINNEKIKPTYNFLHFLIYVSYFPSLLAGPIDRAHAFIPQIETKREFDYNEMVLGLKQILWGLFKKLVIADNCATLTNNIFTNFTNLNAATCILGSLLYAFQLYTDFSGYSDMAIGISRLLGIKLTKNFNFPFFSKNISEFWQKWHISLTSWMTEFVYLPLTFLFRKFGKLGIMLAVLINFIIVGLWHGANFTYVCFGLLQGLFFVPIVFKTDLFTINKKNKFIDKTVEMVQMIGTFLLFMFSAVLLKSNSVENALNFYLRIGTNAMNVVPYIPSNNTLLVLTLAFIGFLLSIEWIGKNQNFALEKIDIKWPVFAKWIFYALLIFMVGAFMHTEETAFIYFQF
jgi:D-alanyl-lipoteichoic acid acyltransferase DltB (MBOAT superfamily)